MSTKQLYEKTSEGLKEFNPLVNLKDIQDSLSDTDLGTILNLYNHIKVDWKTDAAQTRRQVPIILRRSGMFITYHNGTKFVTEFYTGSNDTVQTSAWEQDSNWTKVPDADYISAGVKPGVGTIGYEQLNDNLKQLFRDKVNVTNYPDDEDICSQDNLLKLKDREADASNFQSKGYVILRKNLVTVNGIVKNILTQNMINKPDTIYEIRYDFDLNGNTINIPKNCTLKFEGGSLSNGTMDFNNTKIYSSTNYNIKTNVSGVILDFVFFNWFDVVPNSYEKKDKLKNNSVLSSLLKSIAKNSTLYFDGATYVFDNSIIIDYNLNAIHLKGLGIRKTRLLFPSSTAIDLINGSNMHACVFKDIWFEAKSKIINVVYNNPNDRCNAVNDNIFDNVAFYSDTSDFLFGSVYNYNNFIYHNKFTNIAFHCKKNSACFSCIGNLGSIIDNCYDLYENFECEKIKNDGGIVFLNCTNVYITNSNFTYNKLQSILVADGNIVPNGNGKFIATNCNFEGFTDSFINVSNNIILNIICEHCNFVSQDYNEDSVHFHVHSLYTGIGIPKTIYNNGSNNFLNTIIEEEVFSYNEGDISSISKDNLLIDNDKISKTIPYFYDSQNRNYTYILQKEKNCCNQFLIVDNINYRIYTINIKDLTYENIKERSVIELVADENNKSSDYINNAIIDYLYNVKWGVYKDSISKLFINSTNKCIDIDGTIVLPGSKLVIINNKYKVNYNNNSCKYIKGNNIILYGLAKNSVVNIYDYNLSSDRLYYIAELNTGFYTNLIIENNKQYYLSSVVNEYNLYSYDNYIYCLLNNGTTDNTSLSILSKTFNDITTIGTCKFLCVGKSAVLYSKDYLSEDEAITATKKTNGADIIYSSTTKKLYKFDITDGSIYDICTYKHGLKTASITAERPDAKEIKRGFQYFDVTLNKPIWWTGSKWVDATGADV